VFTQARFENFRSLADVTVPLEGFTVIVGPNGSGKTSVLRGIRAVAALWDGTGTQDYFSAQHTKGNEADVTVKLDGDAAITGSANGLRNLRDDFGRMWRFLVLDANVIRMGVHVATDPQLQENGAGLAGYLTDLLLADRSAFDNLTADLRNIVPQVENLRVVRDKANQYFFELHYQNTGWISSPDVNEGTAIALALLAFLHSKNRIDILLIDDLEKGLHPRAQREVVEILRRTLERFPQMQIIATTHSPYLLDAFAPEEVVLFALDDQGHSTCRRLADHPEIEKWREAMDSGELWASVGEDWIREPHSGT
jgi:predicted ATPase